MKKIIKIFVVIAGPFVVVANRIFALTAKGISSPMQELYGVLPPTPADTITGVFKILIIPMAIILFLIYGVRKLIKNKKGAKK